MPDKVTVVIVRDVNQRDIDRIKAIDPDRIDVVSLWKNLREHTADYFPESHIARFERATDPPPPVSQDKVDRSLREAQVAFCGAVHPSDLKTSMPNVKWAHFSMAGLSSIQHSEFWESSIDVTTSRGYAGARAIAEMAVFGAMMIAKGFQTAVRQTDAKASDGKVFAPKLAQGKTIGVIGLGGIGMNVATIAHGLGLKVFGSRRSATKRGPGEDGIIDEMFPPADLHTLLGESDIVVLATPATAETEHMINAAAFEAMKPGAIFVNISRGENTDEHALASAVASGHLAGAYLDVFTGSEEGEQPPVELSALPNVVITPHIASRADAPMPNTMDLFCSNLRRFLDGQPLENIVDWRRGY